MKDPHHKRDCGRHDKAKPGKRGEELCKSGVQCSPYVFWGYLNSLPDAKLLREGKQSA